jgi:predicted ATP-binding protein involved in virulence
MGKDMSYFIEVVSKATDEVLARAHGDIETVAYHVRKLSLDANETYSAVVSEAEKIGEEAKRTVLSLVADGDTLAIVLKKKLSAEKKALTASTVVAE